MSVDLSGLVFSDSPAVLFCRLALECSVIFLLGRAGLEAAIAFASRNNVREPILHNPNYVALGAGPALLLLVTWVLKVAGLYRFGPLLASLLGIIALAFILNRRFRAFLCRPWKEVDGLLLGYLTGAFAFWAMLGVDTHPFLLESSEYLFQGFNLFSRPYAAELPHFGITFIPPFLYVGHLISSTFAFLSYGNHFAYFAYGLYWLNFMIAPLIPIGAFLLFRRFLPLWPALASAGMFCWVTLNFKIWSLRGESLGWIIGFAFLLVLSDVVSALKGDGAAGRCLRLSPVLALLFFALSLTHSATTFIVGMFSAGYVGAFLIERRRKGELLYVGKIGGVSILAAGLLFATFALSYSGTALPVERTVQAPTAGDPDAAVQFDNGWYGKPLDENAPPVHASPPYMSRRAIAEITALLPPAAAFRRGVAVFTLKEFPSRAIENLGSLPTWEKIAYAAMLAFCLVLYSSPLANFVPPGHKYLFWICATIYASIVLFSVYLDSISVSLYPLASIRRAFVYIAFFYWLAIGIALLDFIVHPLAARFAAALARLASERGIVATTRWKNSWERLCLPVLLLTPLLFVFSVSRLTGEPIRFRALLHRLPQRLESDLGLGGNGHGSSFRIVADRLRPLFDAMSFIRAHTPAGEWVFSNVVSSDNTFWFLSDGRHSLMEGPSIYQLYNVQKEAAYRMREFARFVVTADPAIIATYGAKYALLYKRADCQPTQCSGGVIDCQPRTDCYGDVVARTNLAAFRESPFFRPVFENGSFVIFERIEKPEASNARSESATPRNVCVMPETTVAGRTRPR